MTTADKNAHLAKLKLAHLAMEKYTRSLRGNPTMVVVQNNGNSDPKPGQPVWPMGVTAYPK